MNRSLAQLTPEIRTRLQALARQPECLKRLHVLMTSCTQAVSAEIQALPWSARHEHLGVTKAMLRWLQVVDADMGEVMGGRFLNLPALVVYEAELLAGKDVEHATLMYNAWEPPLLCAMMDYSRGLEWHEHKGVIYELTGPLMDLMLHTEIDADIPIRLVHPPYPMISLKPAQGRAFADLGLALLESFPVEEIIVSRVANDSGEGEILGIQLLAPALTPSGKPQGGMAFFSEIFLPVAQDDETPISARLLDRLTLPGEGIGAAETPENWLEFVTFLLKILLYIGVPSARQEQQLARTEALGRAEREKSPQRREKLKAAAKRLFDCIVIGPTTLPTEDHAAGDPSHREKATHWRRGFFKRQRHGEGLQLTKHIFIAPVLVRADRLAEGAAVPRPKTYRVTARTEK